MTSPNYEDFKIRRMKLGVNFNSSEELASYVNNVLEEISLVNDEIKKSEAKPPQPGRKLSGCGINKAGMKMRKEGCDGAGQTA